MHCVAAPLPGSEGESARTAQSRLGLVVPKRICRSAARRNWIKRMVRESFRRELPSHPPLDCVVRLRRVPGVADVPAARSELLEHWRRVTAS